MSATMISNLMSRTLAAIAAIGFAATSTAAEPLGVVEKVGDGLTIRFDPSVPLIAGEMLAIYGPGAVEKHPLTKETIIERRVLVAKAQIVAIDSPRVRARVTWSSMVPTAGCDVVLLPTENAPNAAPALLGTTPTVTVPVGGTVLVKLPIVDPDHDPLGFMWRIVEGPAGSLGATGILAGHVTTRPEIAWTAPGLIGIATVQVTARDPWGQELTTEVHVQAVSESDWRSRELKAFSAQGALQQPAVARMQRSNDGTWIAIDDNGAIQRIAGDWRGAVPAAFAPNQGPKSPVAAEPVGEELFVLDGRGVTVFGTDGLAKRSIGQVQKPTDLAVGNDGTVYIADQAAGGVLVYEADGKFRARLGRIGTGDDAFAELSRLALAPDGVLYALDVRQQLVLRFDRWHHRLDTWTIQTDVKNPPVDLAVHPKGLLVLLAGGQIQIFDGKGLAGQAWKPLSESPLVDKADLATSLAVDRSGEVYVSYTKRGLIARYDANGTLTGVRGAVLWDYVTRLAADGRGRVFAFESDHGQICEFDPEAWLINRFGGWQKTGGPFDEPVALAVQANGAVLAVLDGGRKAVVRFELDGDRSKPVVFGQPGTNAGQFKRTTAVAMDNAGRTYVLDNKLKRVQAFDAQGSCLFAFGHYDSGKSPEEIGDPSALAVSPTGDAAFVFDGDTYEVKKFSLAGDKGTHVGNSGGKGDGPGQFRDVTVLAVDRRGLLYAWDGSRSDLQVLDFHGTNAVAGPARGLKDLNIDRVDFGCVSPDGQIHLGGKGVVKAWAWK